MARSVSCNPYSPDGPLTSACEAKPWRTRSPAVRMRLPEESPASTTIMSAGTGGWARTRYCPRACNQKWEVTATMIASRTEAPSQRKKRWPPRGLLVLRGGLLIQMADRLQPLEHALHFGFVVGQQERITRRCQLFFRDRAHGGFAPELTVRHAID